MYDEKMHDDIGLYTYDQPCFVAARQKVSYQFTRVKWQLVYEDLNLDTDWRFPIQFKMIFKLFDHNGDKHTYN